jgi:hypothetical protein
MKKTFFYFNTPLALYLAVPGLISAGMAVLIAWVTSTWIRASAAIVIGFTIHGILRGYVRRLTIDDRAATMRSLGQKFVLSWSEVQQVDRYIPSGGVNGPAYIYITLEDQPPRGPWDLSSRAVQIQDRPDALETIVAAWRNANAAPNPEVARQS